VKKATILSLDWDQTPPQAEVRIQSSDVTIKIPLSYLILPQKQSSINDSISDYYCTFNNKMENVTKEQKRRKNHFQRLSEETLMKLPHLRKHREHIKSIDIGSGPRNYNAFREILNLNDNQKQTNFSDHNDGDNGENDNPNDNEHRQEKRRSVTTHQKDSTNKDEINSQDENYHSQKKKGSFHEKSDLFKTELCENWTSKGNCSYGRKCHFAHGFGDMRFRLRVTNYKSQPCCDPARSDSKFCLFGKRCNYAHPGEPLRCAMSNDYFDKEYFDKIQAEFKEPFPFGIYV